MKTVIVFLFIFASIASAQEEPQFEIKDNLFKVGLFNNIPLSENLMFQNGLSIRKDYAFITLDVPVLLKYNITNQWSTFFGAQTRTVIRSFNFEKPSESNLLIGTDYQFKHNTTGNLTISFPLDFQLGIKF